MPGQLERICCISSYKSQPQTEPPHQNSPHSSFALPSEKQMVAALPCLCRNASQITWGLCSGRRGCKIQACSAFRFYKNLLEFGLHFPQKGKKLHYLLLFGKCKRGRGTRASAVILPLGCTSENIASTEVLKEITCFSTSFGYKFLWNWLESGF